MFILLGWLKKVLANPIYSNLSFEHFLRLSKSLTKAYAEKHLTSLGGPLEGHKELLYPLDNLMFAGKSVNLLNHNLLFCKIKLAC